MVPKEQSSFKKNFFKLKNPIKIQTNIKGKGNKRVKLKSD